MKMSKLNVLKWIGRVSLKQVMKESDVPKLRTMIREREKTEKVKGFVGDCLVGAVKKMLKGKDFQTYKAKHTEVPYTNSTIDLYQKRGEGLPETFQNNNALLDQIQKCQEAYLESKRVIFPRFYFLSNDELLEILAQTRNPLAVQPHLRKCFYAIAKLEFGIQGSDGKSTPDGEAQEIQYTNDILAMISPENEKVSLGKGLKARSYVEEWLGKVEEAMFSNLRKLTKFAITDFERRPRKDWVVSHSSQVVLTVSQLVWCRDVTEVLEGEYDRLEGMKEFEQKCFRDLNELAVIVRGELPKLSRAILCALITIDVHGRDMITGMVQSQMMGRFFSGLAQSGAWCCFDEFNRIDIEVLSVIAQQLITIRNAKAAKLQRFMFEGREIKLVMSCAAFITMNPGYAGRTKLPDNLKALFRPMSMMVPDYGLIAEVILYSEGFESSKNLAQKMVQMYKLCSEQLSQQNHYDFGMRAVKSVLVMAGALKRQNPDKNEDVVLIRALRDSNLPKFLAQDAILFQAILSDLFPGVMIQEHDYGQLQEEIIKVIKRQTLDVLSPQVKKIKQFYETLEVRHGVMLVGPTGSGKTTIYTVLAETCGVLYEKGVEKEFYQPVHTFVMNPKAITMDELYGGVNKLTLEWRDGLMGLTVRHCVQMNEMTLNKRRDKRWRRLK